MFFGPEHRISLIEELQVVVVCFFWDEFQNTITTPGRASKIWRAPCRTAAAAPASPHSMILMEAQAVGVNLVDIADS